MSKINITNFATAEFNRKSLFDAFSAIQSQLNNLSDGKVKAKTNAASTVPTTGTYNVGDFVPNNNPSELGIATAKYVLTGWIVIASPNTFRECRVLTGN